MKRTFVVISILLLLTGSLLGYAECWLRSAEACPIKKPMCARCPMEAEAERKSANRVCVGHVNCEPQEAPEENSDKCCMAQRQPEKDCATKCCQMITPLVADGPSRAVSPTPILVQTGSTIQPVIPALHSIALLPDALPPWSIHPDISTTVLRI
ncbi:MAG TPA: hypothetical protein VMS71_00030 [Candidatus Acidoferrum sp.]|nr:hypothetical protein [Candidatus Acidoferrum sp.]